MDDKSHAAVETASGAIDTATLVPFGSNHSKAMGAYVFAHHVFAFHWRVIKHTVINSAAAVIL